MDDDDCGKRDVYVHLESVENQLMSSINIFVYQIEATMNKTPSDSQENTISVIVFEKSVSHDQHRHCYDWMGIHLDHSFW